MSELRALLSETTIDMPSVEQHLDSLSPDDRVNSTRSLGRRQLKNLFTASDGYRAIGLNDIVPAQTPAMQEVVHYGKNSLGMFSHFKKVFTRPEQNQELWGYNRTSAAMETLIGPGYFVAYPFRVQGEVLVDYLRTPPEKPKSWPPIIPNSARLSYFVYNKTQDILRGVSSQVCIGRATKGGKNMNAWFILCRND